MATRNQIISRNSEEDHGRNISVKFHQNLIRVSEKMLKEKVNVRTDGRTTDNKLWHKLAGLRPVELIKRYENRLLKKTQDFMTQLLSI